MKNMNPAIVIVAFDRHFSLKRLLNSIDRAHYSDNVELIISIDKNKNNKVYELAKSFDWKFGQKRIILQSTHLGLKKHVLKCGDLTNRYGSIILLEDDLFVSPWFYDFAKNALKFYESDDRIGGISLYSQKYNETAKMAFTPLDDNSGVYFLQVASSWGQCWTEKQWNDFRKWHRNEKEKDILASENIPHNVCSWPTTSWKKHFIRYMVAKNKYFVYPRASFTTNFHDPGTHHKVKKTLLQVPLKLAHNGWRFIHINNSIAVYDAFHEILPEKLKILAKDLNGYDFIVDLYAQKNLDTIKQDYVLRIGKCDRPIKTFGRELKPVELNISHGTIGNEISLGHKECFVNVASLNDESSIAYYYDIPPEFVMANNDPEISGLITQIKDKEKIIEQQNIKLREISHAIQAILESKSWKISYPIRWLLNIYKKAIGQLRQ